MQQLILGITGEPVIVGSHYPIMQGVLKNMKGENSVVVQHIVDPTQDNPYGLIITDINSNSSVPSRKEYFPSVIGAYWKTGE